MLNLHRYKIQNVEPTGIQETECRTYRDTRYRMLNLHRYKIQNVEPTGIQKTGIEYPSLNEL